MHGFPPGTGVYQTKHIVRFDDLCSRLAVVGKVESEDNKKVVLLGNLSQKYNAMIRIIKAHGKATLLDAKKMLRRDFELTKKREEKEQAYKASMREQGGCGQVQNRNTGPKFCGYSFNCNEYDHKRDDCPESKKLENEFVSSATTVASAREVSCLLDSGASCFNGQQLPAERNKFVAGDTRTIKLTDVLYVLVSVPALTKRGVVVQFERDQATLAVYRKERGVIYRNGKLFMRHLQQLKGSKPPGQILECVEIERYGTLNWAIFSQ
ncbi:uncharacterized protein PHALS_10774 [Plasmopara halstedii]|uniref:Uncharacterized protein n=1 Tax=Plasmopara halstedii TaxID=4781 RepID=A0A0P1AHY1_PLAHL|nr:uncharacterized protein PHALS_10774 [Plasmopara halstedii]CEG40585.1 hypothetical protein PHALS_10774 [Plasmopara halstedii]|eukprot:XP_024576954.1 hypothetical protein PHALS_10774 [Plasmopara halstedii]